MSKFSDLFKEAKGEQSPTQSPATRTTKQTQSKKVSKPPAHKPELARQRTSGRRSDPNYTGAFAYIPAQLHEDVRRQLVGRKDLDFSRLVEHLLTEWINKQK